ncbi:MAG TPA: DNA polymerase III subunit delta [Bacteroidia bacterium]|nr:DNA polymerase III subunit delta [Bacteroidia bacterium]HNT79049.1 DNA polymerase III subunit delta [Bacteroidia bacterium]
MRFDTINFHEKVKDQLVHSVRNGRVPHGILFASTPGAGALSLARAFAQFLLCRKPLDNDSCGECDSCKKSELMIHPDIQYSFPVANTKEIKSKPKSDDFIAPFRKAVLENKYISLNDWIKVLELENKQLFISVEESADILRKINLKSFEGSYKIILMWIPEKMRIDASNKLLKIIEEPPDKTIFILISEDYEQLLPTVRSRLQLIKIPPLKNEEIIQNLQQDYQVEFVKARNIAHLSAHNLNQAIAMALEEEFNNESEEYFLQWMRICLHPVANFKELQTMTEEIAARGREGQKLFYAFALETIRECMIKNYGPQEMVRFTEDHFKNIDKFAKVVNAKNLPLFVEYLNKAISSIERNANPKILFIHISFKIFECLEMR